MARRSAARRAPRPPATLARLRETIVQCRRCARLVAHRERTATEKRPAYRNDPYWGRPVPGFGDPQARLLVIGLAPAAHGGNRTGRMFTGDRSGDWLYGTLHRFGFANQPTSTHRADGLALHDAYVTAAARCAPPDNKPTRDELDACRPFLADELRLLRRVRVVIALGRIAFDAFWAVHAASGHAVPRPRPSFAHGAAYRVGALTVLASYHPSQRNTQTGMLTATMFDAVFAAARQCVDQ